MSGNLESTLYSINRTDEENQAKAMAKNHNLSYVNLVSYPILGDVLNKIPEEEAKKYSLVAFLRAGKKLRLSTTMPGSSEMLDYVNKLAKTSGLITDLTVCSPTSLKYAIALYRVFPTEKKLTRELNISQEAQNSYKLKIKNILELKDKIQKVSTTELLDVVFAGAVATNSSDIHLEPEEKEFVIRYRIDGVLQQVAKLPMASFRPLVSRIKFLAKLKIDITNVPQDGRFDVTAAGKKLDIRTSIIPSSFGEAIVLRILYEKGKFISLTQLGFSSAQLKIITDAVSKPHGIIFNTGPTGSGKTTTLYAVLQTLNKPGVKIITLEDPIEYKMPGVEQSQVDIKKGYTFPIGLRSILRHDPDIIMVGEIRDINTAETAIQAAMTGHLVLTTLHTNNASGVYPRLLDMGIRPYLLGGAINLIIAQRLVRLLCKTCHGKGCKECGNTGFRGRIAISELLVPTPELEILVRQKASLREFEDAAKKAGMITMEQDGMEKVRQGLTTKEEILRVTRE